MMEMRYIGPPTLSVITLIGQHDNGCCQLEKQKDGLIKEISKYHQSSCHLL